MNFSRTGGKFSAWPPVHCGPEAVNIRPPTPRRLLHLPPLGWSKATGPFWAIHRAMVRTATAP